ncbi:hypothetical protein DFJ58DRAFT_879897 [Suillus subalutaceus]|uniref:uncharacterized protein n=1 Tax=Suillus subalutaceus TaxID=48586 RepID=UPI001B86AD4B|nr:uncharacterized protein DFJ58DRAFT_879897 [Suillus subalutaceus]KAG1856016.1 hypothetical protein DFJ58DRAFT_879897 [Suillus subalutaceus]
MFDYVKRHRLSAQGGLESGCLNLKAFLNPTDNSSAKQETYGPRRGLPVHDMGVCTTEMYELENVVVEYLKQEGYFVGEKIYYQMEYLRQLVNGEKRTDVVVTCTGIHVSRFEGLRASMEDKTNSHNRQSTDEIHGAQDPIAHRPFPIGLGVTRVQEEHVLLHAAQTTVDDQVFHWNVNTGITIRTSTGSDKETLSYMLVAALSIQEDIQHMSQDSSHCRAGTLALQEDLRVIALLRNESTTRHVFNWLANSRLVNVCISMISFHCVTAPDCGLPYIRGSIIILNSVATDGSKKQGTKRLRRQYHDRNGKHSLHDHPSQHRGPKIEVSEIDQIGDTHHGAGFRKTLSLLFCSDLEDTDLPLLHKHRYFLAALRREEG